MTTSRKLPILLAASTIVLSLFAVAPASAVIPVKQKCFSTGTASETFRHKAGWQTLFKQQAYKVSVKGKVCLSYTMVSKLVRGKIISQPEVSAVSEELTVSHSGYLPEKDGQVATELLPGGGDGLIGWTALADSLPPRDATVGQAAGHLFTRDSDYSGNFAFFTKNSDAWAALAEPGFSCSRGRCRPVKKSLVLKRTHALSIASDSRVFLHAMAHVIRDGGVWQVTKLTYLYWDNGDPCGTDSKSVARCAEEGVKPVTTFKIDNILENHNDAWRSNATFVGIPADLRDRS